MTYDPVIHHRRSIRLKGFNYRTPGLYVITICTEHRVHLFGRILDSGMDLSPAGEMVLRTWEEIPDSYPGVDVDSFVVMPNHIHGIVYLAPTKQDLYPDSLDASVNPVGTTPCGCPSSPDDPLDNIRNSRTDPSIGGNKQPVCGEEGQPRGVVPTEGDDAQPVCGEKGQPRGVVPTFAPPERLSLPDVVHRFKTLTTYRYGEGVKNSGWSRYPKRLWQHNYYERVVRNEKEIDRFRRYIEANPAKWHEDPYRN